MYRLKSLALLLFCSFSSLIFGQQNIESIKEEQIKELIREKTRVPLSELRNLRFRPDLRQSRQSIKSKAQSTTEVRLSSSTSNLSDEGEGFLAINPNDSNHLIVSYMDFGDPNLALKFPIYYSMDGGATWQASSFDPFSIFTQDYPSSIVGGGGDPVFAFADDGTIYYSWIFLGVDTNSFQFDFTLNWASSVDNGATFQVSQGRKHFIGHGTLTPFGTIGDDGDGIFDRQWFAVDNSGGANDGRLYNSCVFFPSDSTLLAGDGIVIRYKDAGVDSFAVANIPISPNAGVQFANVVVDGSGGVHVAYGDLVNEEIMYSSSTNGSTFSTPKVIAVGQDFAPGPVSLHDRDNVASNMVVDLSDDHLYVVYTDFPLSGVEGYFLKSPDGGATWSSPLDISTIANGNQVLMPTVSAYNGKVSISWYDVDNSDVSTQYTIQSLDKGATWGTPTVVSLSTTNFATAGTDWYGDYHTSVRTNCKTYTLWSDGRSGSPKMYVGITKNCQGISIEELSPITDVVSVGKLFPNPAKSYFTLEVSSKIKGEAQLNLLDLTGKKIAELSQSVIGEGENTITIELPSYISNDTYLVEILTPEGRYTRKLQVQ